MSSDWHICRGQAATSIAITESRWLERPLGWHQRGRPFAVSEACLEQLSSAPPSRFVQQTRTPRTEESSRRRPTST